MEAVLAGVGRGITVNLGRVETVGIGGAVQGRLWFGRKAIGLGDRWEVNPIGPSGKGMGRGR